MDEALITDTLLMHLLTRFLVVFCCAAFMLLPGPGLRAQSGQVHVDYTVLIDVSGSMTGLPPGSGNYNIFPRVQQQVSGFVQGLEPGTRLTLATFSDGLKQVRGFDIRSDADRQSAVAYVRSLQANGTATHVYGSVREVFEQYIQFRGERTDRVAALLVFTDGIDNGPEGMTMREVVEHFRLRRQENDFLYYATLGVPLSPADSAAIEDTDFGRYDRSERGQVPRIVVVQPLLSVLNFGNLMRNPDTTRAEPFRVIGAQARPSDLRVTARAIFPELEAQGVFARVRPESFAPEREVRLGFEFLNIESMVPRDYRGRIRFESADPTVLVIPSTIRAGFAWTPPRTANLVAPPGRSRPELVLGRLDPYRKGGQRRDSATIRLDLDREARARGGEVAALVKLDPNNPVALPERSIRLNGRPGLGEHMLDVSGRALTLAVEVDAEQVRPGRYSGTVTLEPGSVEIRGSREVPWSFEVAKPPLSWGTRLLIALAVLAALAALAFLLRYLTSGGIRSPTLKGRLTVRAPSNEFGKEVELARKRELLLAPGEGPLPGVEARIRIFPERTRTMYRVKIQVEEGSVQLRRVGEPHPATVASEVLHDRDRIFVPPYELEFSEY